MEEAEATLPNPFESGDVLLPDIADDSALLASLSEAITESEQPKHPNFPACFPIVYHSIAQEIPPRYASVVSFCLFGLRSFGFTLILTIIAQLFSDRIDSIYIFQWRELILSVFIFIVCWSALAYGQYFPVYVCARDEARSTSLVPFQFFTIFVMLFMLLGIPGTGMIGIWYTIIAFQAGQQINRVFAVAITITHIVNIIVQVVLVILFAQFSRLPRRHRT